MNKYDPIALMILLERLRLMPKRIQMNRAHKKMRKMLSPKRG